MGAMKPPVRGAGNALLLACALALAGCAGAPAPAARDPAPLVAAGAYTGGRLASGAFQILAAPVALAVQGGDLYVAEATLGAVFRLDTATLALSRLAGAHARPGLRLRAPGDGTLLVLDPVAREFLRLSREGQVLQRLAQVSAADFALEPASGRILFADRGQNRLELVTPGLGAAIELVTGRGRPAPERVWTVAAAAGGWYAVDRGRREILRLARDGRVLQSFGATVLKLPGRIESDAYDRVFVHDAADEVLHVFGNGEHLAALSARELGVTRIADFAIAGSQLALAGAPGEGLRVFRLGAAPGAR